MKPGNLDYLRPKTVEEATNWLATVRDDAEVLSGGQSLVPLMNLRLAEPSTLVDVTNIPEMKTVRRGASTVSIGAAVTHAEVGRAELIRQHCPLLTELIPLIAHPQVRNRGTIGGSIAHADGAAEVPAALTALDGEVIVRSTRGSRSISWRDLFQGPYQTDIARDEVITDVIFPVPDARTGTAVVEFAKRPGDFAIVGAIADVQLSRRGKYDHAALSLFGVSGTPVRASVNDLLAQRPAERYVHDAVHRAVHNIGMASDLHASADYRKHLSRHLGSQAILKATARAQHGR